MKKHPIHFKLRNCRTMKKLLLILLFAPLMASAQHGYISSSGNVILDSGSIERYSSPDIYVDATYQTLRGVWVATLQIVATGATTGCIKTYQYEYDNATVDALTPTGSTTTEKTKNVLLQAVKATLTALNGGTTFTLN